MDFSRSKKCVWFLAGVTRAKHLRGFGHDGQKVSYFEQTRFASVSGSAIFTLQDVEGQRYIARHG